MLVCVTCDYKMQPGTNDVLVLEYDGDDKPFRLWAADMWVCSRCGEMVLTGFGKHHLAEAGDPTFVGQVERARHSDVQKGATRVMLFEAHGR